MKRFLKLTVLLLALTFISRGVYADEETIRIDDVRFADKDGAVYLIKDGSVSAEITAVNSTLRRKTLYVAEALYDGDKMVDVKTFVKVFEPKESAKLLLSTIDTSRDKTLKLYTWCGDMQQCRKPVILDGNIETVLRRFDDEVFTKELLDYIISLYDPETGGYYYSVSARDGIEFLPDVESTKQAFGIFDETELFDAVHPSGGIYPAEAQSKVLRWVQMLQDEGDGYFYHPQWGKGITTSRQNRDLAWSLSIIRRFGGKPLYLTPEERLSAAAEARLLSASEENRFESEEAFMARVKSLPWDTDPYSAGNTVAASKPMITASGYMPALREFVSAKQNKDTGLWGEGLSYDNVNALMKITSLYSEYYPIPMADKIVESVIYVVKNCEAETAATPWNAVVSVNDVVWQNQKTLSPKMREELKKAVPELVGISSCAIKPFKKPDGGYSWGREKSTATSQLAWVSYGLAEGDLNATALCTVCLRDDLYYLAGVKNKPALWNGYRDYFYNRILNAPNVTKKEKPIGGKWNFEKYGDGEKPYDWQIFAKNNYIGTSKEAENIDNKVLEFLKDSGDAELFIPLNTGDTPKSISVSFDIMQKSLSPGPLYYNMIGNNGIGWCMSGNKDGTMSLSQRTSGNGVGTEFARLEKDRWYNIKFVYEPGLAAPEITVYKDGVKASENNDYFNKGKKESDINIKQLKFTNFQSGGAVNFFLDNLCVEVSFE